MILGHAEPSVVEAIVRQASRGTSYGAPTALETATGRTGYPGYAEHRNGALCQ